VSLFLPDGRAIACLTFSEIVRKAILKTGHLVVQLVTLALEKPSLMVTVIASFAIACIEFFIVQLVAWFKIISHSILR
jgi:hypothetical protein